MIAKAYDSSSDSPRQLSSRCSAISVGAFAALQHIGHALSAWLPCKDNIGKSDRAVPYYSRDRGTCDRPGQSGPAWLLLIVNEVAPRPFRPAGNFTLGD
jgi:hypothetical protein